MHYVNGFKKMPEDFGKKCPILPAKTECILFYFVNRLMTLVYHLVWCFILPLT